MTHSISFSTRQEPTGKAFSVKKEVRIVMYSLRDQTWVIPPGEDGIRREFAVLADLLAYIRKEPANGNLAQQKEVPQPMLQSDGTPSRSRKEFLN